MNTNTLFVKYLKYEYTQFLLFIFANIIRSSTPPLAIITALQKVAKELSKYDDRARTYDLLLLGLMLSKFRYWQCKCCNPIVTMYQCHATRLLPVPAAVIGRRPVVNVDVGSCCYNTTVRGVLDEPALAKESLFSLAKLKASHTGIRRQGFCGC